MTVMQKNATASFGRQVRNAREAAGLPVEGLAFKAGMTVRTIERIEAGQVTKPHRATARAIADALGLELADLQPIPAGTGGAA